MAAATAGQRAAAEALRAEGNTLFGRGKFAAAAERYTEAIALDAGNPVLFVNRALCAKKRAGEGCWDHVEADARSALALDASNLKAHYLLGLALREKGQDVAKAITHLGRALESAREKGDAIKSEIWRELAKANDAAWREASAKRSSEVAALRQQLHALQSAAAAAAKAAAVGAAAASAAGSSSSSSSTSTTIGGGASGATQAAEQASATAIPDVDLDALERVFERAGRADARGEVPSAFTCPLTMEVFHDPVTSTSGHTYERAALQEHLAKVGKWDPITRVPMSLADVRPNISMRNAVQLYLEEHGWAWHECF